MRETILFPLYFWFGLAAVTEKQKSEAVFHNLEFVFCVSEAHSLVFSMERRRCRLWLQLSLRDASCRRGRSGATGVGRWLLLTSRGVKVVVVSDPLIGTIFIRAICKKEGWCGLLRRATYLAQLLLTLNCDAHVWGLLLLRLLGWLLLRHLWDCRSLHLGLIGGGVLTVLSMQLLDIEHLKSFVAQSSETLVNRLIHGPNHELEESTCLICRLVGISSWNWKCSWHIVNTPISHFLDLHENWDDLAHLTTKVMLEDLVGMSVEDLDQSA